MKNKLCIFIIIFAATNAFCQKPSSPCKADVAKYCGNKNTKLLLLQCLVQNEKIVTPGCKSALPAMGLKEDHCALDIVRYCPSPKGFKASQNPDCFPKIQSKISSACSEGVRKSVALSKQRSLEKENLFIRTCAEEVAEFCPGVNLDHDKTCIINAWKKKQLMGECKKLMDEFDEMRKASRRRNNLPTDP